MNGIISKFEETDSLDISPRRGRYATDLAIVEKKANATNANSSMLL